MNNQLDVGIIELYLEVAQIILNSSQYSFFDRKNVVPKHNQSNKLDYLIFGYPEFNKSYSNGVVHFYSQMFITGTSKIKSI